MIPTMGHDGTSGGTVCLQGAAGCIRCSHTLLHTFMVKVFELKYEQPSTWQLLKQGSFPPLCDMWGKDELPSQCPVLCILQGRFVM